MRQNGSMHEWDILIPDVLYDSVTQVMRVCFCVCVRVLTFRAGDINNVIDPVVCESICALCRALGNPSSSGCATPTPRSRQNPSPRSHSRLRLAVVFADTRLLLCLYTLRYIRGTVCCRAVDERFNYVESTVQFFVFFWFVCCFFSHPFKSLRTPVTRNGPT